MKLQSIDELLNRHAFFADMRPEWLELIAGCGQNVVYRPDALLAREDDSAEEFFAVRRGKVAIELHSPGSGTLCIQTLGDGSILGFSWLFPPHRWRYDVRALETTHAVHFDGKCLREKCDASPDMGYEFMKRFAQVVIERLTATQLQLLDVYGKNHRAGNP